MVMFLLSKGADIEAKDNFEETALLRVARNGDLHMTESLLSKGADIEARFRDGKTLLMYAAEGVELIKIFGIILSAMYSPYEINKEQAKPSQLNDLSNFGVTSRKEVLESGMFPLHARLWFMEYILKISYNLTFKSWKSSVATKPIKLESQRKNLKKNWN
ncbi:hypothetical protein ILUMI_03014 [Ignelater luminosus]|uniref:Ankyrin repeat protein n=1 Tax=Ignelater luminosus TaxID=2038154 RepID=A0A8K0DFG7_IGNLU|nr:hypothetical protein ILUMI_03014 [Ignelater luminosus]